MMPVHRVIWGTAVPDLIHRLIDKITFNDTIRKSCNIFYFSLSFFSLLFVLVASVCVCVCVIFVERDQGTVCDKMMAVWIFEPTLKGVSRCISVKKDRTKDS